VQGELGVLEDGVPLGKAQPPRNALDAARLIDPQLGVLLIQAGVVILAQGRQLDDAQAILDANCPEYRDLLPPWEPPEPEGDQ